MASSSAHTLVLIGGGHTHALILRHARRYFSADTRLVLLAPERFTPYSGMLPGLVAGHYRYRDCHIDLAHLCQRAGAELITEAAVELDLERREVITDTGRRIGFAVASLNTGLSANWQGVPGAAEHACPVKPIGQFLPYWQQVREQLQHLKRPAALGIVGAGAGGVELAMAMQYGLRTNPQVRAPVEVHLIDRDGHLPPGYPIKTQLAIGAELRARGIRVHPCFAVGRVEPRKLSSDKQQVLSLDETFWCTSGKAAPWPGQSGLATDAAGFVAVSRELQSLSHPEVFAAGDIASMEDEPLPKAGVYAVRQAPILGHNLAAQLAGRPLNAFRPQRRALSIISCGDRFAVANRGGLSVSGRWVWYYKRWLDRRFMALFPRP